IDGASIPLGEALAAQTKLVLVHPVFFGSARTGAGVDRLMSGLAELLPAEVGDSDGPVSATVFKIERGPGGEKIAYVRAVSGTVHTRDRVRYGADEEEKVTAIVVFDHGTAVQRPAVSAGKIAKLSGLSGIRIGDSVGDEQAQPARHEFPPPTLESVVDPVEPDDRHRLRVALAQLAEHDPLIDVRHADDRRELSGSLYGELQKEVIEATLAHDYGIAVAFRETTRIYVERPVASGEAVEVLHADTNPFNATIGLRLDPAPAETGLAFELDVATRDVPLFVYKSRERFAESVGEYVRETL